MRITLRAAAVVTLAGEPPARGLPALDAAPAVMKDALITVSGGRIERIEPYASRKRPSGVPLLDLGDITLGPGLVNCHCHLELSHLLGKTISGRGFVPWLESLVSLIAAPPPETVQKAALDMAVKQLCAGGTAHVGDIGSRAPALVREALATSAARAEDGCSPLLPGSAVGVTHFLEAFGFGPPATGAPFSELDAEGYTPAVAAQMPPDAFADCAIAGHALYSTSPEAMRATHGWCRKRGRPFSLHLAEFPEEVECLALGRGALYDLLGERLLPAAWKPPGLHPVDFAGDLGLLDAGTLAVHCTQCRDEDIRLLAHRQVAVCLCPRSNAFIGAGLAPARAMARAGVLLCLGTDGLSSNYDLDLRREMTAAMAAWGLSPQAVLRMAAINGAYALGIEDRAGSLTPGKAAVFSRLGKELVP